MERLTISCESCERTWKILGAFSIYKQQNLESCPCPHCGAYTLSLPEPGRGKPERKQRTWQSRLMRFAS